MNPEVVILDDPESAASSGFVGDFPYTAFIPRFCHVLGAIAEKGEEYTANPCPD